MRWVGSRCPLARCQQDGAANRINQSIIESRRDRRALDVGDREHNAAGRGRSIQDAFTSNGVRTQDALFRNTHFLEHVRYFIHGPNLRVGAIQAFRQEVADRGMITSSDALPLAKAARTITRQYGLRPQDAAEEFYKLALELDVGTTYASTIREYVKKTR